MASCGGLSNLFLPRPGFANIGKTYEPVRLILSISSARKHKRAVNATLGGVTPATISGLPTQEKFVTEYEQKIEEIRQVLQTKGEDDPSESLVLVDAIQRVGLSSYYEQEIETILRKRYVASCSCTYGYYSLHDVSLFFRLLRQQGHYISPDVFNNFKDKGGRFRRNLLQDIRGLMELYEAAQLSFQGEHILDEAASFSSHRLRECLPEMDNDLSRMITGKLKWWNELGLAKEIKLARNQLLKWYTWSMSILIDDFSLSLQRMELTKAIAFVYLIDDIFDVVGTLDELTIFTEAVNKWDYAAIDTLPDYMKMCYRALLDTMNGIGHEIYKRHGYDPIDSLKTSWERLCDAYLTEAKWFASGDLPTAAKYLENGKVTTGAYVVLVHLFFLSGLGNGGGIRLTDVSQLVSSVATILRLWDDLGSAKDEHQDGRDGSYMECYRNDHRGLSRAQARDHITDTIASEWKILNKECFCLNDFSTSYFRRAALNAARIVPLMYSYDEKQQLPVLEEHVKFILFNQTNYD
ncbi:Tricyclene synthase Oc15, chloroplastic [Sesamum angolense]|uniref:Tricyclene synthase Oc15, chloroplastic n=1 Tax=Sesamum angolense TaxID=2727404 RepID=A0AAE2BV56_9LAMI|nr:Tricyclene synthase Oc15, chloroplastic [Sesamum angolense]